MEKHRFLKDAAKAVRAELKAEFPKCKFSVRVEHHSEMVVSLMTAPFAAFSDLGEKKDDWGMTVKYPNHSQLNRYQLLERETPEGRKCNGRDLTPEAWSVMRKAMQIAKASFSFCSKIFFLGCAIGKWDKHFEVKVK